MALQTKTITGSTSSSNWTWKMDVIENSTNTNNNTSSVTINTYLGRASSSSYFGGNANCKIVCNGETRSINKNFSYPTNVSGGGWVLAQSETFTVGHNADGSKSIGVSSALSTSDFTPNSASASGEMSLTTIPRASSVSGGSGNIGASSKITITRASSNFTHTLTYAFGTLTGTIATGVGTSYDWTIPTTFYAQIPNANSGTGTITCITYSGSTEIGRKSISFTANVTNSNPTTGSFTYKDSSTSMVNITQNDQRIIRNKSYLVFVLGTASAKNSATISKYEVTFNGVTKSSTTATNLDFGTINLSSNATATLKVTDSRGNTATKQITVIIDDWVLPTGLINIQRKNNYYSETYIKVDGTCSSLNGKNSMTIQYKYKKVSDSSYSSLANLTDNVQETLTLDNQYQWNVVVVISDKIGQTTYNLFVDRGTPIIYYDRKKSSVGINTFPTENEALRVAGGNINIENTGTDVGYQQGGNMILRHNLGVTVVSGSGGDVMLRPKGSTDSSVQFKITQKGTISVNDVSVIAYGSYSFGNYVKFYDGTMIQWNYEEVTDQAINNAYGSLYQGTRTITYPVAFVGNPPVLTCSMFKYGTSASWGTTTENDTPLTKGTLRGIDAYIREAGTTCRIGWFAIGRWKS